MENIGKKIIIGSGPIGSALHLGDKFAEELNIDVDFQKKLADLYHEYRNAGSDFIITNTFSANSYALEKANRKNEFAAININAVKIAATANLPIFASIGPLDLKESMDEGRITEIYEEQIELLKSGGNLAGLLLETFGNLKEARCAIKCAAASCIPFIFSISGNRFFPKSARKNAVGIIGEALENHAMAVGANCAAPFQITDILNTLQSEFDANFYAAPNAGTPELHRGKITYALDNYLLLHEVKNYYDSGVAIIGGCCGISIEQIKLLADNFKGLPVKSNPFVNLEKKPVKIESEIIIPKNRLRQHLPEIAIEMRFKPDENFSEAIDFLKQARQLADILITIPDCPTGNPGCDNLAASALIRREIDIPVIVHQASGNRNLCKMYAALFGSWALEIDGVMAVSGDSPTLGPFGRMNSRNGDIPNSVEFLKILSKLAVGELINESYLKKAMPFFRCCAFSPSKNLSSSIEWLRKKIDAGSEAVFTQPFFDIQQYEKTCKEIPGNIPLFAGLLILTSLKQTQNLQSGLIPGIEVPQTLTDEMAASIDPAACGFNYALEFAKKILADNNHLYLILPFSKDKYQIILNFLRQLKRSGGCESKI